MKRSKEVSGRREGGDGANLLGDMVGELLLAIEQLSDRVGALEAQLQGSSIDGLTNEISRIETVVKEVLVGGTAAMEARVEMAERAVWVAFDNVERLNNQVTQMKEEDNNSKALIARLQRRIEALEKRNAEQDARLSQQAVLIKLLEV